MRRGGGERPFVAGQRCAAPLTFKEIFLSLFPFVSLFVFFFVSVPGAALGAGPAVPPVPTKFVTDKAAALSAGTVASLEQRLESFEKETSNQFLVYTERAVPEGTTLEEYTVACAQAWKAGQTQRKNGMILFVFPGSRKVRLEVGYGLEGAMPDALARRVLDEQVLPRFRTGDYDGGISAGVEAAIAATKGEYKGIGSTRGEQKRPKLPFPLVLLLLFLFFFVILPAMRGGGRGKYWYMSGGGFGGGGFGGGFGGGGGGGGGFSGGGGSFGGGGASGDW
ncbi:MAG TPA: TPM domain-containing protein [Thermoanaerobaculia bacterium]